MKDLSKCTHLKDGTELVAPPIRANIAAAWPWSAVIISEDNIYSLCFFNDAGRCSFGGDSGALALPIDWVYVKPTKEGTTVSNMCPYYYSSAEHATHRYDPDNRCVLYPREKWDAEDE